MSESLSIIIVAIAALGGIAIVTQASLSGWRGWLELQRATLAGAQHRELANAPAGPSPAGARIELADLRERVRKLEAIAAGIDL